VEKKKTQCMRLEVHRDVRTTNIHLDRDPITTTCSGASDDITNIYPGGPITAMVHEVGRNPKIES
jgi:hypothetical protein